MDESRLEEENCTLSLRSLHLWRPRLRMFKRGASEVGWLGSAFAPCSPKPFVLQRGSGLTISSEIFDNVAVVRESSIGIEHMFIKDIKGRLFSPSESESENPIPPIFRVNFGENHHNLSQISEEVNCENHDRSCRRRLSCPARKYVVWKKVCLLSSELELEIHFRRAGQLQQHRTHFVVLGG